MAIQVSGVNVIDDQRNLNVGVLTATSLDVPPSVVSFSPTDGSSDVSLTSNIVITFNATVEKGSGNITLKEGDPSTGNTIETIAVSSGSVSISGGTVTINPSDFPTGKNIYVVVDDGAFTSAALGSGTDLINTYNFTTGPITTSSFSPSDGATSVAIESNIVITFSENITKETNAATKYIRLRAGGASGTIRQTIDVSTSAVSVSGNQATINPPSDLQYSEDTYVVVDEDSFFNSSGDAASGNAVINTYNFTTEPAAPPLGNSFEGGTLILCSFTGNYWIVAPTSTQVRRDWWNRADAVTTANANAACGDWFIPSLAQLKAPGWQQRQYWDVPQYLIWSNQTASPSHRGYAMVGQSTSGNAGGTDNNNKNSNNVYVRAFRCVTY